MTDVIDAGDVVTTRDLALDFLTPLAARDWTAPIPDLDWNCETTLRHMIKAQSEPGWSRDPWPRGGELRTSE
jgi:hypothetical protein